MTSWIGRKCKTFCRLLRRRRPEGDTIGAWSNFNKVLQTRAYYAHIIGLLIRLPYFLLNSLQMLMNKFCTNESPNTPLCDLDGAVGDVIPFEFPGSLSPGYCL